LDINLPGEDGYKFLSEISSMEGIDMPEVICLTQKNEVTDKVTAFSLGADDYITKPINFIEFRARVDAKLKKSLKRIEKNDSINLNGLEINITAQKAVVTENEINLNLTSTEFKLLICLGKRVDQVFSRLQLLENVWGDDVNVFERAVDVHICSLRKKLGYTSYTVKSVPGVGYKLTLKIVSETKKAS